MNCIIPSFNYCLRYLNYQLHDLNDDLMVKQPADSPNHPAWVVGHIVCSCQASARLIDLPGWLSEEWILRHGTGSTPVSDKSLYGSIGDLQAALSDARNRISTAIVQLSSNELERCLPPEPYGKDLPTVAVALTQMLVGHTSYHIAQLTTWRKLMNLPSLDRHFL